MTQSSKPSILFAPLVTAGNSTQLCSVLQKRGYCADGIDYFPNYLGYKSSIMRPLTIPVEEFADTAFEIALKYDVIVLDFMCSFYNFPPLGIAFHPDRPLYEDVEKLRKKGKTVLMSVWGSDVRAQSHLHWWYLYYNGVDCPRPPQQTPTQRKLIERLDPLLSGWLVPPSLKSLTPRAAPYWDTGLLLDEWPLRNEDEIEDYVVVAATDRRKKNFGIIEDACKGKEFRLIEGRPRSEVLELTKHARVAFPHATGTYGLFAVECMAQGIPVVCGYDFALKQEHRDEAPLFFFDLPKHAKGVVELAWGRGVITPKEMRDFVNEYHNIERLATILENYLEEGTFPQEENASYPDSTAGELSYYDIAIPYFAMNRLRERAMRDIQEATEHGKEVRQFAHLI